MGNTLDDLNEAGQDYCYKMAIKLADAIDKSLAKQILGIDLDDLAVEPDDLNEQDNHV